MIHWRLVRGQDAMQLAVGTSLLLFALGCAGCGSSGRAVARLGCDEYCQQAGAPEGNPELAQSILIDTTGTVIPLSLGTVPVTLSCRSSSPCRGGALLLAGPEGVATPRGLALGCAPGGQCLGRSSLDVAAHSIRTLGVPLSAVGRELLRSYGRISAFVLVEFPPDSVRRSVTPIEVALSHSAPAGSAIVSEPDEIALDDGRIWITHENQNTVTEIDASTGEALGAAVRVASGPDAIAAEQDRLWVASRGELSKRTLTDSGSVTAIDAGTGTVVDRPIVIAGSATALAAGGGGVWVSGENLARIEASNASLGAPVDSLPEAVEGLAVAEGRVWVAASGGVTQVSSSSGEVIGRPAAVGSSALGAGDGSVWVADAAANSVARIGASSGTIEGKPIQVGLNPDALAVGEGDVWVANGGSGTVTRIEASTGTVLGTTKVGLDPDSVAVGDGSVWVANALSDTVTRLDARTGKILPFGSS